MNPSGSHRKHENDGSPPRGTTGHDGFSHLIRHCSASGASLVGAAASWHRIEGPKNCSEHRCFCGGEPVERLSVSRDEFLRADIVCTFHLYTPVPEQVRTRDPVLKRVPRSALQNRGRQRGNEGTSHRSVSGGHDSIVRHAGSWSAIRTRSGSDRNPGTGRTRPVSATRTVHLSGIPRFRISRSG